MSTTEFFKVSVFNLEPDFLKLKNDIESGLLDPQELDDDDEDEDLLTSDYEEKVKKPKKKKNSKQLAYCFEEGTLKDYEELMNSFNKKTNGVVAYFISEETFYSSPFNIIRCVVKYKIEKQNDFPPGIKF